MSGKFIISLDCEGKWGMADKLQPHDHRLLTDDALARVYDDLIAMLGRYQLPATFAFVMAFTLTPAERERFAVLFEADDSRSGGWLSFFRKARRSGALEGWFQPHALEAVRQNPLHEIACHGFCHRSLADDALSADDARIELESAEIIARAKRLRLRTFVYPRNAVGHVQMLADNGYLGYRDQRPRPQGRLAMVKSLVDELNLWTQPERRVDGANDGIVRIPAGFFFNWRFGARRVIPPAVTVQRWKNLLDQTAERGGVAHLWLHPHNLITAPDTREPLESVLAHAARLAASGRLEPVTQETYCRTELAIDGRSWPHDQPRPPQSPEAAAPAHVTHQR